MTDTPDQTPPKKKGRPKGRAYPHHINLRFDDDTRDRLDEIKAAHNGVDDSSAIRIAVTWYAEELSKKKPR